MIVTFFYSRNYDKHFASSFLAFVFVERVPMELSFLLMFFAFFLPTSFNTYFLLRWYC
jgi:uncharacterized membrane-anchored protein